MHFTRIASALLLACTTFALPRSYDELFPRGKTQATGQSRARQSAAPYQAPPQQNNNQNPFLPGSTLRTGPQLQPYYTGPQIQRSYTQPRARAPRNPRSNLRTGPAPATPSQPRPGSPSSQRAPQPGSHTRSNVMSIANLVETHTGSNVVNMVAPPTRSNVVNLVTPPTRSNVMSIANLVTPHTRSDVADPQNTHQNH